MRLTIAVLIAFLCAGCDGEKQNTNPAPRQLTPANVTRILATDSCGCRVYEIKREGCTVYVNNNGGIAVLPDNHRGPTSQGDSE